MPIAVTGEGGIPLERPNITLTLLVAKNRNPVCTTLPSVHPHSNSNIESRVDRHSQKRDVK